MKSRFRLVVLPGGRPEGAPSRRRLARSSLRVLRGGRSPEMQRAIAEALDTARQMRREIEQRLSRAMEPDERG
jgi:hypothetical protein